MQHACKGDATHLFLGLQSRLLCPVIQLYVDRENCYQVTGGGGKSDTILNRVGFSCDIRWIDWRISTEIFGRLAFLAEGPPILREMAAINLRQFPQEMD